MLHEKTISYIKGLSDYQLVEYLMIGRRVYEEEPLAFAQKELEERKIAPETLAAYRLSLVKPLAQYDRQASVDISPVVRDSILCQGCGYEVPTRYAEYKQNVGALIMRISSRQKGCYCTRCHWRIFLETTLITMLAGWWGLISLFVAPYYVVSNIVAYAGTLTMPPFPPGANRPTCNEHLSAELSGFAENALRRLKAGDSSEIVAREIAANSGRTPGEAFCYVVTLIEQSHPQAVSRR